MGHWDTARWDSTLDTTAAPVPREGRAPSGRYLERLPKRCSNRATRPPVSRIFCLPV